MLYIASYILIIICFTPYKPNTINLIGKIKSLELEIIKIFEISTIQISMLKNFVESKNPLNLKTLYSYAVQHLQFYLHSLLSILLFNWYLYSNTHNINSI